MRFFSIHNHIGNYTIMIIESNKKVITPKHIVDALKLIKVVPLNTLYKIFVRCAFPFI